MAYSMLKDEYEKTRTRLNSEVISLNNRGKLNLSIGILISVFGILFVGYNLITAPEIQNSTRDLIAFYVPRTSFVILIEIVAFFFLNLYRASLNDIKYFQNEMTNVESKFLGVEMLIFSKNMDSIFDMALEISKTERNFTLNKEQTTVVLEKEKLENIAIENISRAIGQILTKNDS